MKAADLSRFLLVCSLVSDLYCPGYNPRQSLEKNSNLARVAASYKLDTVTLAVKAGAELSAETKKSFPTSKKNEVRTASTQNAKANQ